MSRTAIRNAALATAVLATILTVTAVGGAGAQLAAGYCSIPTVNNPPWGFHAGQVITGANGSYARGHGDVNLSARTASGIICQVDRSRNGPYREITLSVGHRLVYASHYAVMFGVSGNIMKIDVRVHTSTDPKCPVRSSGEVTIFASYNNVHKDSVQFSFPGACKGHRHLYTGLDVVTNVPPE
jgi:hypothetical protein